MVYGCLGLNLELLFRRSAGFELRGIKDQIESSIDIDLRANQRNLKTKSERLTSVYIRLLSSFLMKKPYVGKGCYLDKNEW